MSTKIEWADMAINPVVGCSKCSPGCDNCYAERFAARLAKNPATAAKYAGVVGEDGKWTGKVNFAPDGSLAVLYNSRKSKRVFVGSMCDLFHENTPQSEILSLIGAMSLMSHHTFMLLTKRPDRARDMLDGALGIDGFGHIWLGVTVCNQQEADEKIPVLLQTPAAKRFVSVEPMLGRVEIGKYLYGSYECALSCGTRLPCTELPEKRCTKCGFTGPDNYETWGDGDCEECPECGQTGCCGEIEEVCPDCGTYMVKDHPNTQYIDWVICGGETGPGARPMHPNWVRSLRDQCVAASVPFFFKGWGDWCPRSGHNLEGHTGLAASNIDPECKTWKCVRLTEKGNSGWDLKNTGEGEDLYMQRVGKKLAGRLLDGVEHNSFPEGPTYE